MEMRSPGVKEVTMKIAVAYYSRYGTTAIVANTLAQKLYAELRVIEEKRKHGFLAMGVGATFGMKFAIKPMNFDFSAFDIIVLCTPVWAFKPACPTMSFLSQAHIEGKRVIAVFLQLGSPLDKALQKLKKGIAMRQAELVMYTTIITQKAKKEDLEKSAEKFVFEIKKFS